MKLWSIETETIPEVPILKSVNKTSDKNTSRATYKSAMTGSNARGSSSGGGKSSEPKTIDPLKDIADRYHQVNTQIEKTDNKLSLLSSQQDKFVGTKLIDNLNKQ
jgi:hypothetical protein